MLVFDQVRGEHSTGVAFVPKNDATPTVVKAVGTPDVLMDMNKFTKAMSGHHRALIGHNRFATVGKVNAQNAHPFTCGNITGVHNGSLRNYHQLDGHGDFAVDSNVLYNHIAKHGLTDAISKVYGAMALVWWNEEDETINFYRNSERPLFFATDTEQKIGFLASEDWMIYAAAGRNSIQTTQAKEVPVNTLFTLKLPKNSYEKLGQASATSIAQRVEMVYPTTYLGRQNSPKAQGADAGVGKPAQQKVTSLPKGVYVTYTGSSSKKIHGYEYAEFYEETSELGDDSREFVMPIHVFNNLPKQPHMGDTFLVDSNGTLREGENIYYTLSGLIDKFQFIDSGFNFTLKQTLDRASTNEGSPFTDADEQAGVYLDNKGQDIGEKAWMRKYGTCAYCNGDVSYHHGFKFNTQGGVYCDECISSPVTADILPR